MFDTDTAQKAPSPLYDWRPMSTYIRRPPYWEGALAGERTLRGMRPLAILPDNITTDHILAVQCDFGQQCRRRIIWQNGFA